MTALTTASPLQFSCSDQLLTDGFAWAKAQALAYVFHNDPLGDWYEAALPGRAAFCMRDVSHQAAGAQLLGLARHTHNMLLRFAENISPERDWCTFWEIDQHNRPCPVDYQSDQDFWYNLPANFDLLDCCLRQYRWTGSPSYRTNPALRAFYALSVAEYVRRWDKDGDGLLEHDRMEGYRGIATYNEQIEHPRIGSDLLAAQAAAYRAYAEFLSLDQRDPEAEQLRNQAELIRAHYDRDWWNTADGYYHSFRTQSGSFAPGFHSGTNLFCLYFGLIQEPARIERTLDQLIQTVPLSNIEERSYLPETLFRYGRCQAADDALKALLSPTLARREYPEVSYALIGALGTGLMGFSPEAHLGQFGTLPCLPQTTAWAEMTHIPFSGSSLRVRHEGQSASQLTVEHGSPLTWRAAFPGSHRTLLVDDQLRPALPGTGPAGQPESFVLLTVRPGETHQAASKESG